MLRKTHALRIRVLFLLVLAALIAALPATAAPVAAQAVVTAPISPLPGSYVNGSLSLATGNQGAALLSVTLLNLGPRGVAQLNLNAGTCAQPSASVFNLLTLTADDTGRATANVQVQLSQGASMSLSDLADGNHVLVVISEGRAVACGAIPALAQTSDFSNGLLAEGERQQVMQFNPNAALQKRIFADGYVPNSAEFRTVLEATTFAVQRAEHLRTGVVRAYFARVGDWGNVGFAQRGTSSDALGRFLLDEAERMQAIRFNPIAALQRRIFADNFVPNSGEFAVQIGGVNYTAQRAEHLRTGRVRVYYAVTPRWNDVRFVDRTANIPPPGPTVTISPTSGPSGTVVRVTGTGFGFNVGVAIWGGPVGSEGVQVASGVTNPDGAVFVDVPVQGAAGMRWVFGITAGPQHAESGEFTITG